MTLKKHIKMNSEYLSQIQQQLNSLIQESDLSSYLAPLFKENIKPTTTIIGRIADDEPLFQTEIALGYNNYLSLIKGLAAAGVLLSASRLIFAVRSDTPALIQTLHFQTRATRIEVIPIEPNYPLDDKSLLADLRSSSPALLSHVERQHTRIFPAQTLIDLATVIEGRTPLRRVLTVAGDLREPKVIKAPVGTPIDELVSACGGCPSSGWVPYYNGILQGHATLPSAPIDYDCNGIIILPPFHPRVIEDTTPIPDEIRRLLSACTHCQTCSMGCPVHLNDSTPAPSQVIQHLSFQNLSSLLVTPSPSTIDPSLHQIAACQSCRLCSLRCPSQLKPDRIIAWIKENHSSTPIQPSMLSTPYNMLEYPRARTSWLSNRLGINTYSVPAPSIIHSIMPEVLRLSTQVPFPCSPVVTPGDRVKYGDLLALPLQPDQGTPLRSPVPGIILAFDPEDGLEIRPI